MLYKIKKLSIRAQVFSLMAITLAIILLFSPDKVYSLQGATASAYSWTIAIIFSILAASVITLTFLLAISILSDHDVIKKSAFDQTERYSKLLQASPFAICETDLKGKIELINPAGIKMFGGTSEDDFLGLYLVDLVAAKDQLKVINLFKKAVDEPASFIEFEIGNEEHSSNFSSCIFPILSNNHEADRIMVLTEDITARHQKEKDLIKAKANAEIALKAKANFIGNMNHELRTPLNHILGFAQLLQNKISKVEEQEMVSYIISGGEELLDKVNSIVELSGGEDANTSTFRLFDDPAIRTLVGEFAVKFEKRDKLFSVIAPKTNSMVHCDINDLVKAIKRILDNALKFTNAGDLVTIHINEEDDFAVIKITDNGPGIPHQLLNKVAVPFEILDDSFTRMNTGMGLGLAASKKLIQRNQGLFDIQSELGKGTCVTLRIPLETNHNVTNLFADQISTSVKNDLLSNDPYQDYSEQFI